MMVMACLRKGILQTTYDIPTNTYYYYRAINYTNNKFNHLLIDLVTCPDPNWTSSYFVYEDVWFSSEVLLDFNFSVKKIDDDKFCIC